LGIFRRRFFASEPDPDLSGGVNRFSIKSSVYSHSSVLVSQKDGQTDGRKSDLSIAYVMLAKKRTICADVFIHVFFKVFVRWQHPAINAMG